MAPSKVPTCSTLSCCGQPWPSTNDHFCDLRRSALATPTLGVRNPRLKPLSHGSRYEKVSDASSLRAQLGHWPRSAVSHCPRPARGGCGSWIGSRAAPVVEQRRPGATVGTRYRARRRAPTANRHPVYRHERHSVNFDPPPVDNTVVAAVVTDDLPNEHGRRLLTCLSCPVVRRPP